MKIRFAKTVYHDNIGMFVGQRPPQREIVDWIYDGDDERPVYSEEAYPVRSAVRFSAGQIIEASESTASKYIALGWAEPV
jgi:hypothetical protein